MKYGKMYENMQKMFENMQKKFSQNMQQHIKICRKYAKIQNMQKKNLKFCLIYSFVGSFKPLALF